ncbi:carbonic anhydrase family protein [Sulfuriflexus sp.]|uniref:carbonic anhydrase n=1 Tax=Sulfuriflexus sp. TaxID=2015443 RepID=UPI0028CC6B67|nr:carbonic anhydrase family protein [Sulfuriflexus sp.]MDT8403855.1 carbonic anhydrase family protein [Sulfuriflexus sp.]
MHNRIVKTVLAGICLLLAGGIAFAADASKSAWGYDGPQGPAHWGDLAAEYATCKTGKSQSPINIITAKPAQLAGLRFHYQATDLDIVNNGHTIQVNYAAGSSIEVGGKRYRLLQFHFHSPSEHAVDGRPYDMVAHLVHQAADGQLGVIAVLMRKGKASPVIESIWAHLPRHAGDRKQADMQINITDLLPATHSYYSYTGSLTTPPCSEGVNWMVLQTPVEVSAAQIATFSNLFSGNVRPHQPLHERVIHAN